MKPEELFLSRYSHLFMTNRGVALIYTSKGNSFVECDRKLYDILNELKPGCPASGIQEKLPEDIFNGLISMGILCDKNSDDDYLDKFRFVNHPSQHDKNSLGIIIAPTLDCNFSCPYCFEKNKRMDYMSSEVRDVLVEFIIKNSNNAPISLTWYGGEPLLAIDVIKDILARLVVDNIEIKDHRLITNGFLLTSQMYDVFDSTFPLNSVQITLDGDKRRHDTFRALKGDKKSATYDIICNNISDYADAHPLSEVHVRVNIDKNNYSDYEQIKKWFSEEKGKSNILVYPGFIRLEDKERRHSISPAFNRWEIAEHHYRQAVETNSPEDLFPKIVYYKNCTANRINSYIVGPQGEIYKCWNDVSDPNSVVGNIADDKITNPTLYYRYHSGCSCFNDPECLSCFCLPICHGKCSWYQLRNKYYGGEFNLCQCLLKAPGMMDKILEQYYEYASKGMEQSSIETM